LAFERQLLGVAAAAVLTTAPWGCEASSGDESGEETGDTAGTADRELGSTPNFLCDNAMTDLESVRVEVAGSGDAVAIAALYADSLQGFVQIAGVETGRVEDGVLIDDAAILASIAGGTPGDLIDAQTRAEFAIHQYMRKQIATVADQVLYDPNLDPALLFARWDTAWCIWDAGLRPHAQAADSMLGDSIEMQIDEAFLAGHAGIDNDGMGIDLWETPPNKQIIEKSTFRFLDARVRELATIAVDDDDAMAAREALGLFQLLEDRMEGKNTPGIAIIEESLGGAIADIDVDDLHGQLAITWAKRTRKYTSLALEENLIQTYAGKEGATEGKTYARITLPHMIDTMADFDADAYLARWDDWIGAIVSGDADEAAAASGEITNWVCDYQENSLGIATCTSSEDE
jgi:hypothetical protein